MRRNQNVNKTSRTGTGRPRLSFISPQPHTLPRGATILVPTSRPYLQDNLRPRLSREESWEKATLIAVKFKQQGLRQRRKAQSVQEKGLFLSKNYCRRSKSARIVSTKLHTGVNFWIRATHRAFHRLEAHPRLKIVILSAPQPFTKKPMAPGRSSQEAQIICSFLFPLIRPSDQPDDSSPRQRSPTSVCEILR